jgi:ABC-2 type transport system permease protein
MVFYKIFLTSLKQQFTYRTAMIAGLATNLFFGFLRAAFLVAIYAGKPEVNQMSIQNAVTYVGISQAMIAFLTVFGNTYLMQTVYDGSIGSDLLRPVNFFLFWMSRDFGQSVVNLIGRGLIFMAAFSLFYPINLPTRLDQWAFFLISLVLAWLISFSWRFLVNLAAFWTPEARGIARLGFTFSQLFSGFIMPLRLLPDWFSQLCQWTPFPAIINTPVEIFLGVIQGSRIIQVITFQFIWLFVLVALSSAVSRAGVRRLVIQGG